MTGKRLLPLIIILGISLNFSPAFAQEPEVEPEEIIPAPPRDNSALTVEISTDGSRYSPEAEVKFNYRLSQDGYLYLFGVDPDGEVSLLFPNKYDRENRMEAGEGELPRRGYSFLTGKEEGVEYYQAVASRRKLPLFPSPPSPESEEEPFPALSEDPAGFSTTALEEIEGSVDEDDWDADWTSIEVTNRPGRLYVTSDPVNAKIYIDDEFVGRTPDTVDVKPGEREVKLLLGSDLRWTGELSVGTSGTERLAPKLERVEYATISVGSEPPGAEIYVDGEYRGETPRRISVEAGELRFRLEKDGYDDWEREFRLFPNESRRLEADLRPEESYDYSGSLDFDGSFGLGFNLGGFRDRPISPGLELSLNDLIVGASFYGSSDPELPEKINWEEVELSGQRLDYGPEWEIYLGYHLNIYGKLYLKAGAGMGIQPQAQLEELETSSNSFGLEPMIDVARDAQLVYEVNPALLGGLQLKRGGFFLQLTYHTRRGPVIGLGYEF